MMRFRPGDRIIWRNGRGRLCHGIVQFVYDGALIVEETVTLDPRKGGNIYDDAFFQIPDEWKIVQRGDVVKKANL